MVTSFPRILIGGVGGNCIVSVLFVLNGLGQTSLAGHTSGGVLRTFQQQLNVYLISYWHLCGVVLLCAHEMYLRQTAKNIN